MLYYSLTMPPMTALTASYLQPHTADPPFVSSLSTVGFLGPCGSAAMGDRAALFGGEGDLDSRVETCCLFISQTTAVPTSNGIQVHFDCLECIRSMAMG